MVPSALWADAQGRLTVIDGDTFEVGGITVRLFGVDAPEHDQTCTNRDGAEWSCGVWVSTQVTDLYGGREALCTTTDIDRYGREVARCTVAGADLGRALVAQGLATAYRDYSWDYDLDEKAAQVAGLGIWAGTMQSPAAFRADQAPPPQAAPGDCVIKGNISASGQIYHLPGQGNYDNTRIDPARGERWFCSEAEAARGRMARGAELTANLRRIDTCQGRGGIRLPRSWAIGQHRKAPDVAYPHTS